MEINNAVSLYFSPTGSTRRIVTEIARNLPWPSRELDVTDYSANDEVCRMTAARRRPRLRRARTRDSRPAAQKHPRQRYAGGHRHRLRQQGLRRRAAGAEAFTGKHPVEKAVCICDSVPAECDTQ
mgnify:CR=1 FL=1